MVPLSRQTDFFVPEMKEEVKTDVKEEDSDEDRGTDITGNTVHFVNSNLMLLLSPHQGITDSRNSRFITWHLAFVLFCFVF